MLSSFERLLIWRYLLPGGEGRIVVLVAAIGMTAVTIGVASLIVVMSLMNGVRTKIGVQFAGVNGHASIVEDRSAHQRARPPSRVAAGSATQADVLPVSAGASQSM